MTPTNTVTLEPRGQAEGDGPALDVAVVGAGQAGLAMAWQLRRHGLRFAVLDAASQLGQAWRTRWDSLRLFTPARFDALPEMPFPAPADHYPTKEQVADYLHDYAAAGLYVLGQPWQRSRGSALLGFVARDAADLAHHIAEATTRRNHRCDTGSAPRRLDPASVLAATSPRSTP